MPASFKRDEPSIRNSGCHSRAAIPADHRVLRPLNHQGRAWHLRAQPHRRRPVIKPLRVETADDRLWIGLRSPPDGVLNMFGRVWFGERLSEEELQESAPVPKPVVAVSPCPPPPPPRLPVQPGRAPHCSGGG